MKQIIRLFALLTALAFGQSNKLLAYGNPEDLAGLTVYDEYGNAISELDVINGIGAALTAARGSMAPATAAKATASVNALKAAAEKRAASANVAPAITNTQKFLFGKRAELPKQMQSDIEGGLVKFTNRMIYYLKPGITTVAGIYEVIASNDRFQADGFTNLDQYGEVPATQAMVCNAVTLKVTPEYVIATETVFDDAMRRLADTAKLQHASFVMEIDKKEVLRVPVHTFTEGLIKDGKLVENTSNSGASNATYNFDALVLIKGGSKLQFKFDMPDGTTYTARSLSAFGIHISLHGSSIANS